MTKNVKKFSKTRGEFWKDLWHQPCRAQDCQIASQKKWLRNWKLHPKRVPKQCKVVQWNLVNPRGNGRNLLSTKITKTTLQAKDLLRCRNKIWCTRTSPSLKRSKFGMQEPQWMRNGRSPKRFQPGSGQRYEQKGGHSGSTTRQKESPHCHIDGHVSRQKIRSRNQNYKNTKAESVLRGDIVKDNSGPTQILLNRARLRPR